MVKQVKIIYAESKNSIFVYKTGEGGTALIVDRNSLTPDERQKYDEGNRNHAYNSYVSDMISLHRKLPDVRYER